MAADNANDAPNGQDGPAYLSVEAILSAPDTPEEVLFIKQWNGSVKIKGLTKRQQVDIRNRAMREGPEPDPEWVQRYMWLEAVIEPRFTEEQLGALFEKNAGAVDHVLSRVLFLSGMDQEAIKRREATFPPGTVRPV